MERVFFLALGVTASKKQGAQYHTIGRYSRVRKIVTRGVTPPASTALSKDVRLLLVEERGGEDLAVCVPVRTKPSTAVAETGVDPQPDQPLPAPPGQPSPDGLLSIRPRMTVDPSF